MTGVGPSILLHPLDFMGCDDDSDLAFFPAMKQPAAKKIAVVADAIDLLARHYRIVTMRDHAYVAAQRLPSPAVAVEPNQSELSVEELEELVEV